MSFKQPAPVSLVTGAARRVGAAIAQRLHAAGHRVVVHYRSSREAAQERVDACNDERPGSALALAAELGSRETADRLVAAAVQAFGRLDLLVNNASDFYPTPVGNIGMDDWERLFDSNARGPLFLSQAAAPHLAEAGGAIVNLVDIHARHPRPEHTVYCMAKAALVMMTRSLALELAPAVRVNAVAPGAILWAEGDNNAEAQEETLRRIPLDRLGEPADIAGAVVYLGLENPYLTGQVLVVDGGRSLHV